MIMSVRLKLIAVFVSVYFAGALPANAQKDDKKAVKEAAITKLIREKKYVFHVDTSIPMGGRSRRETPGYTLKVQPNKLTAEMPYYGRAYNAGYGSSDAGIRVNSTKFEYKVENRKKGGWDITIKPTDAKDLQQFYLTVQVNGSATLQVTSNNRQPINFDGFLDEK
jgi:hypothetical protein